MAVYVVQCQSTGMQLKPGIPGFDLLTTPLLPQSLEGERAYNEKAGNGNEMEIGNRNGNLTS